MQLKDILEIENDPSILEFKCQSTGIVLWPLIRVLFFRLIEQNIFYKTPINATPQYRKSIIKRISTYGRGYIHNRRYLNKPHNQKKIILSTTGSGNILVDGKWFNRLSGYFAKAYDNETLVLEELFDDNWFPSRHNTPTLIHNPLIISALIVGKIWPRRNKEATLLLELIIQRTREILRLNLSKDQIKWVDKIFQQKVARLPRLIETYESLFKTIKPKLIILEQGCYGDYMALMISLAKEMGITTAEYQHGMISSGHDAYNFAGALRDSINFKKTLPEFFLGYGNWWNAQINAPINKLSIGNPYRTEQIKNIPPLKKQKNILILGDGIDTEFLFNFAEKIAKSLKDDLCVVFRPHPLERSKVNYLASKNNFNKRITIDTNANIYQSFSSAYAVISEASTGLFEAAGISKHIFVWDTAKSRFYLPIHPFRTIHTNMSQHDLCDIMSGDDIQNYTEELWASNWESNYFSFVEKIIS